ncbi:carbon storage regulator [Acetanaerobacterium elongatum]|uniref:Translational regulator CsrA n=1 Tax=Acetanaerobacterium elongatum TaxID=258515 RepID=A0A1G9ZHQ6_9FIRM|nr:carbon storage regulator [Acetanaerobacterium elongatum]SDN20900.1 carbon storage regulator, CsrA [Acetanaerobacterium elongatum]
MLVISRKINEGIVIGENIELVIVDITGDKVKLGINAPREIRVIRNELLQTEQVNREAATPKAAVVTKDLISLFGKAPKKP